MTRAEHLAWCKQRALEYLDEGDLQSAFVSMLSDMRKHEETAAVMQGPLSMIGMMAIQSGDTEEMRRFIEGFN